MVAGVGRLHRLPVQSHGGHGRGSNDPARRRAEDVGAADGRLLRVALRAVLLVAGAGADPQGQGVRGLLSGLASKPSRQHRLNSLATA